MRGVHSVRGPRRRLGAGPVAHRPYLAGDADARLPPLARLGKRWVEVVVDPAEQVPEGLPELVRRGAAKEPVPDVDAIHPQSVGDSGCDHREQALAAQPGAGGNVERFDVVDDRRGRCPGS